MKAPKNCLVILRRSTTNPACWVARTVQQTPAGRVRDARYAGSSPNDARQTALGTLCLTESSVRLAQAFNEIAPEPITPQLPQAA